MTKSKRKNSGQASPSTANSPSNVTDPTKYQTPAGQASSATQSSIKPLLPPGPPPLQPLPPHPAAFTSTQDSVVWSLVQTLPSDLRVFLEPDYETKLKKILKVQFYRILLHFDPATKSRVTHLKADLNAAFKKDVLPRIQPFLTPRAPAPMDTDDDSKNVDFNPLGRKTTRKMLIEAIRHKAPNVIIPAAARRDGLLLLYQQHVDKGLIIPGQTLTIRKPHAIRPDAVEGTDMEDLRLGLQCHAPHIFLHSIPMTHQVLVDCYMHFIHEEPLTSSLVAGFHYSVICL
ncbi:uncharacterized protein MELLADRAFT_95399 [Melampsora larici-populina 98AG31]|uniref:Uncharacterized protein n=1 Tax=Melampsora larici-populina (strain 98AG31 / pathotype 3-4-7) TaxID=747676 RepID=F4S961_MELLP|nr:uncharacterized protein MELLADRAFT_95399 [Melampsora larici-populina 98AG31]EGF98761.1 hypothetical protein MELLADRAFT_95399 [Melampsora larici-populina 98AG31]